jgi:hypothetical protein
MLYATATYGFSAMEAAADQKQVSMLLEPEEQEPKEQEPKEPERKQLMKKTDTAGSEKETLRWEAKLERMYKVNTRLEKVTRKKICEHIGLKEDDIIAMFVKPGGNMFVLRHFLAVDTDRKAVVLAIRGTFSVSGVLIDTQAAGGTLLTGGRFGRVVG